MGSARRLWRRSRESRVGDRCASVRVREDRVGPPCHATAARKVPSSPGGSRWSPPRHDHRQAACARASSRRSALTSPPSLRGRLRRLRGLVDAADAPAAFAASARHFASSSSGLDERCGAPVAPHMKASRAGKEWTANRASPEGLNGPRPTPTTPMSVRPSAQALLQLAAARVGTAATWLPGERRRAAQCASARAASSTRSVESRCREFGASLGDACQARAPWSDSSSARGRADVPRLLKPVKTVLPRRRPRLTGPSLSTPGLRCGVLPVAARARPTRRRLTSRARNGAPRRQGRRPQLPGDVERVDSLPSGPRRMSA